MTVAELIERLKTLPPDALVLVDAYEDDQDTPDVVVAAKAWAVPPTHYTGSWRVLDKWNDWRNVEDEPKPMVPVVYIGSRKNRDDIIVTD